MAQKIIIAGRKVSRPGVYSLIESGVQNTPASLDYGHVVIVDDGVGAEWGGGESGVVHTFDNINNYRDFVKGGTLWDLGLPLFKPFGTLVGASKVSVIQARDATSAEINLTLQNGSLKFTTKDKGVNANGVLTSGYLAKGYGAKLIGTTVAQTDSTLITTVRRSAVAGAGTSTTLTVGSLLTDGQSYVVKVSALSVQDVPWPIATYVKVAGDTTTTLVATAIKNAINANNYGFTATSSGAVITITSANTPNFNGAAYNNKKAYLVENGGTPIEGTFTGGIQAQAQANFVLPANVKVGLVYTLTFTDPAVTINVTSNSTSPNGLANQLGAAIQSSTTLTNAGFQSFILAPGDGTVGLMITRNSQTPFTQTSSVVEAPGKLKVVLYHSSYKGTDPLNNTPYDGIPLASTKPIVIAESPELNSIQAVINWATSDSIVSKGFVTTGIITPNGQDGIITKGDVVNNSSFQLATGAGESYNPTAFTNALETIASIGNSFFLASQYGSSATATNNSTLVDTAKVSVDNKYQKFVFIGGGATRAQYTTISKPAAAFFDTEEAIVVHGDGLVTLSANTFKRVSSLYKAANVVGRLAGLPPQTPITFKRLLIDAEYEPLNNAELEDANDAGVLTCYKDDELGYCVVQIGINTLQNNSNLVNEDSTSYSIQLNRIKAQLNKELCIHLKKKFFSNQTSGPNRSTISKEELESATDKFLESKHFTSNTDNYLQTHSDVVASVDGTVNNVNYKFTPNFESNIIVATGTMVDVS